MDYDTLVIQALFSSLFSFSRLHAHHSLKEDLVHRLVIFKWLTIVFEGVLLQNPVQNPEDRANTSHYTS